jgi:Fe-S oxidoreductase
MSVASTAVPRLLERVEAESGQNVYACYQCGKCMAGCPFGLAPQQVVRLLQLGQVEAALAHPTTWHCASCLACATVCPKGLNPARLQRTLRHLARSAHRVHGDGRDPGAVARGLRTALFAHIHRLSRWGSALAPVSNWLLHLPGTGLVAELALGIHRARPLPPFARPTFPAWFRRHQPQGDGHRGRVLLFHDTFMDYNFPQTGISATELLERAGFRVELADMVCCGRPMISKGLLDAAARQARANLSRLYEPARQGLPIVGCEPSCLLTLRDDYPELVSGPEWRERARTVAAQARLIDEFLAELHARGMLALGFRPPEDQRRDVLFHAHCHQRALAVPEASLALLRLAGYRAELTDAPCCGMAGAYGFEREHYESSRAAGERSLFPAVRATHPGAQLAVMGTSCRQQLEHFTGRRARHVVELLRDALA